MRCSCVPIHFGDQLVGVAKLVADPATSDSAFSSAIAILKLVVSEASQDSIVTVLSEEVRDLRKRAVDFRRIQARGSPGGVNTDPPSDPLIDDDARGRDAALVDRALAYLQGHHQEPGLSLPAVAKALECNPRYLTTRFSQVVGERMHTHLLTLRVAHACRLLLSTDLRVKEVANASGFRGAGPLAGAFRRHVGVSPGEYRRIFASP